MSPHQMPYGKVPSWHFAKILPENTVGGQNDLLARESPQSVKVALCGQKVKNANSASFTHSQFFTVMAIYPQTKSSLFWLKVVLQVIPAEDDEELSLALDFADSF